VTTELIELVNVIPDYIRKLDKRRIAAEKCLDARNKKIEYLEDEVKRFVMKHLHSLLLNGRPPD
jgi:archaellum component FlaC